MQALLSRVAFGRVALFSSLMGIAGSGNCSSVHDVGSNEITLTPLIHTSQLPVGMISVCGLVGCMSKIAFFLILRHCVGLQASAKLFCKLKSCIISLSQLTSFGLSTVAWYFCIFLWRHPRVCMRFLGTNRGSQVISMCSFVSLLSFIIAE